MFKKVNRIIAALFDKIADVDTFETSKHKNTLINIVEKITNTVLVKESMQTFIIII